MEQLAQFVSKQFEGPEPRPEWGPGPGSGDSSRGSVSPVVDPEDSRSPPCSPGPPNPTSSSPRTAEENGESRFILNPGLLCV